MGAIPRGRTVERGSGPLRRAGHGSAVTRITGWLFSAPAAAPHGGRSSSLPFILAFYFSFTNERLLAPPGRQTQWVGLDNYVRVFENPRFWTALTNNIAFASSWCRCRPSSRCSWPSS